MPSKDVTLPPGGSMPHEFVEEEGLDGSARPEIPWYQEPPSIAYCMHAQQIVSDCIPRGNLLARKFSQKIFARWDDRCRKLPFTQYPTENSPICRLFEVVSILIGEQIDFDGQRHALRIERPEAGQAVLAPLE